MTNQAERKSEVTAAGLFLVEYACGSCGFRFWLSQGDIVMDDSFEHHLANCARTGRQTHIRMVDF